MQNTFHELPALTVVVTGFNQESSIRGAIESVLNQDYAGKLEYIFSDDASSDGTFQIMREMEQAYRGSHSIKLNRNEQNMGITDHLEKVYSRRLMNGLCEWTGTTALSRTAAAFLPKPS